MKLYRALSSGSETRSSSLTDYLNWISQSRFGQSRLTLGSKAEEIKGNFEGLVQSAYKSNGIIFACMLARQLLFSEARFQFRRRVVGRPGELFGTKALEPLEEPWPNGTTGNLLTRMIQDADLAGDFFAARRGNQIRRLYPEWVTIILGSNLEPRKDVSWGDVDVEPVGYIYQPGGAAGAAKDAVPFNAAEVCHFAPIPDPSAAFRGMSWLTPVIRDIMGDQVATTHKLNYFEQGACPAMVVTLDATPEPEAFEKWVEMMEAEHSGVDNAHKTLYLTGGAKGEVVGSDLRRIDFKAVQAAGENRIAVASRIPAVILGIAEGLESATMANFANARRLFADQFARPMWREAAGSLAPLIKVPPGAELWFDSRDISYLQEDQKDAAEIQAKEAATIKMLVEAGYDADTIIEAVTAEDLSRLKGNHTGLTSVQLQPPVDQASSANGSGDPAAVPTLPSGD